MEGSRRKGTNKSYFGYGPLKNERLFLESTSRLLQLYLSHFRSLMRYNGFVDEETQLLQKCEKVQS